MKTKEELNKLKEEVKNLGQKLAELNDEEIAQVTGGGFPQPKVDYIVPTSTTEIDPLSMNE